MLMLLKSKLLFGPNVWYPRYVGRPLGTSFRPPQVGTGIGRIAARGEENSMLGGEIVVVCRSRVV